MTGHEMPGTYCPDCGALIDGAMCPANEDARPVEGDLTVCIYCAAVLAFGPSMRLVRAPEEAWEHPHVKPIRDAVKFLRTTGLTL
jgi:hypothetical protein